MFYRLEQFIKNKILYGVFKGGTLWQRGREEFLPPPNKELTYEKTFKDFNNGRGSGDNCHIIYNL